MRRNTARKARRACGRARGAFAEALERRVLLSTFTVTNTADSGTGSLRQAIVDNNTTMGTNAIVFSAAFSSSPHTINFTTPTQQINGHVTITGPGASLLTITRSGNVTASSNVFNSFASSLTMSGMTVTGGNINGT